MSDEKNELAGKLMKLARAIGEEMSESEALALVNDAFFAEAFSHSAPTPDVSEDDLRKIGSYSHVIHVLFIAAAA